MNVFDLYAKITLDTSEYEENLNQSSQKTSMFGDVLKANLTSQVIISGVKKLASAVVEVGKASFYGYSQSEQLVGGVETLFKESANVVQEYAANAYKTAGLSANEYMSTVTSFSASLLDGLGQDTAAAAEYANTAINDMSDNANKMGTSMEAIQNAYQGFAKQNFVMLDNLKLGYGGTKTEMERLLSDAEEIKRANGEMVSYSIDSFADMVEAINVVQENMGITGTTAKEAESTITGSLNAMKAAWSNLATGMANEEADMEKLTQRFVDSVGTAAKNIMPRVQQILTGVGTATVEAISYLKETNQAVNLVVTALEDVVVAAGAAGAALVTIKIGNKISTTATIFKANAEALEYFTVESGKAAVAEATLNGAFSVGEIAVGLLTGKITLATASQYAWNTAMNLNPIMLVVSGVTALGVAVHNSEKKVKELADSFVIQAETAEEAKEHLAELQAKAEELEAAGNAFYNPYTKELEAIRQAIAQTKNQIEELEQATASSEMAEKSLQDAETLKEAAQTYADSVQGIMEDYYNTYDSIYNGLHNIAGAFTDVTEVTEISWEKAMENIAANTAVLDGMDDNFEYISRAASEARVDISGFSEMLASMSTEDAAGLLAALRTQLEEVGPTSGEAATTLTELSNSISAYSTSGTDYSQSLALTVEDVSSRIVEATNNYNDAVGDLDQAAEAQAAGESTMKGLLTGIQRGTPGVLSTVDSLADQMKSRLKTSFDGFVLNIQANVTSTKNGSFKSGLDYVPFDGFIAELHKGERVLTAEEASAYRSGKNSGDSNSGIVIYQYIQTPVETPAELAAATEAYFQQARWTV